MKRLIPVLISTTVLFSTGLVAGPETEPEEAVQAAEEAASEEPEADAAAAEPLKNKDRASGVMDVPLDGSSLETFTAGLENVDANASEKEYRNLMSALDFLLFYDLGAKRDKVKLYARLNGKSPNDILAQVAGIKGQKHKK